MSRNTLNEAAFEYYKTALTGGVPSTDEHGLLEVGPDALALSGSVTSAAVLFTQDCVGYESISVQVTSAGTSCTITYETSDDNTNWVSSQGVTANGTGTFAPASTSTTADLRIFRKAGRYFRARVSTYGSGTVSVVGHLHKNPQPITNRTTVDGPVSSAGAYTTFFPIGVMTATAQPSIIGNGQAARAQATATGAIVSKPYSYPEADWQYAAASGGIVDTADNVLVAAAAANIRNYLTRLDLQNTDATVGTEVVIKDGSTVIWRTFVPASVAAVTQPSPTSFEFPTPLRGTAATALNVACITTSAQVYVNAGGYQAP